MSIAPAKRASIAEGPALKLLHSIFTFAPMAFSNQPLALPIMGWAWVMFGKAPTRTTVVCALRTIEMNGVKTNRISVLNFICQSAGYCRARPSAIAWLHFSCGFCDAERAPDQQYRRSWCSREFSQQHRGHQGIPDRERDVRHPGQSGCAVDQH